MQEVAPDSNFDTAPLFAGEKQAWDAAYPEFWKAGMAVANARLQGSQHCENRSDIVISAIGKVQRKMRDGKISNQYRSRRDLMVLMTITTKSLVADFLRRKYRRGEESCANPDEADDALIAAHVAEAETSGLWDRLPEDLDSTEVLWQLVGRLKPPKPELIIDHYIHDKTAEQISRERGMPRGTVLSHWREAKAKLRQWLSGDNSSN